ncbi:O-antigen ligase family protein [Actinomarinicola tropica]|uniref:O-antigen ligase-related domain-containing protein n=1 Tax=Actinomarinicola tropica TaxID=2789776 RepID=A0A5Q2RGQ7_9ACTN|nr:O-antigen ligase family protein [Actinomarinicola tropica]QGG95998.1 hypothetical protein GH723_13320 [Actinomarinicola tropica]
MSTLAPSQRAGAPAEGTPSIGSTPLWIVSGHVALLVAVMAGFGALEFVKPKMYLLLLIAATVGMILLGPIRQLGRLVISLPVLAYLSWWVASYMWTFNEWVWVRDTQDIIPTIVCLTAIVSLMPLAEVRRGLVLACQVTIAWNVLWTLMSPGLAMNHMDGTPGWRGSFIHKNGMAPFMLFAVITFAYLERRPFVRNASIAVALAFVVLSQSTTSLVVGTMLLVFAWFIRQLSASPKETWSFLLTLGSTIGFAVAYLGVVNLPTLVGAAGKDPTLTSRTEIWANSLEAIGRRPWSGYGIGGVWINNDAEPTRTILRGLGFIVYHAHNGFIEILLQLGIIGLALFFVLVIAYFRTALVVMLHDTPLASYLMAYAALILLLSISEVATFGQWLAFLCAFHALALRVRLAHLEGELR